MSRLATLFLNEGDCATPAEVAPQAQAYTLLFVDDEPNVLKSLHRIFRKENYEILLAPNAAEALRFFAEGRRIHLVISDHRMPGMTGAELLKHIKEQSPDTIRIMLTGHADVHAVMGAINEGAVYKFITKPWNDDDLRITVGLALDQYDLIQENRTLKREGSEKDREIKGLRRFAEVSRSQVGRFLVKQNKLSVADLNKVQKEQRRTKEGLVPLLLRLKLASEDEIFKTIAKELKIETVSLPEWRAPAEVLSLIPQALAEDAGILPLRMEGKRLVVALSDPTDFFRIDDLSFVTGLEIKPVLVKDSELRSKIREVYGETPAVGTMTDLVAEFDPLDTIEVVIDEEEDEDIESLLHSKDQPPAIRIVNAIISEAVRLGASDVHIEPRTKHVAVRYRLDGLLTDKIQAPPSIHLALVSRLKILAELDIAERRKPQDGRITVKTARKIVDLRISTMPTMQGEKVVLRILDRNASVRSLTSLGVEAGAAEVMQRLARTPQGIVLATGPTGSGKTTTLYALLAEAFDPAKNYVTIEDPIEYYLEQAGQVHVREKIGLDFATVLRAVLRQDPDVILLGEIRDLETARVSFHAALTGHLVLSTLHTNSAIASVVRLKDLGLDIPVITSALRGIISQRLVRRLCPSCLQWVEAKHDLIEDLDAADCWKGKIPVPGGCDRCHGSGYAGRLALVEILEMNDPLREVIRQGGGERKIREVARNWGFKTLLEDGIDKAAEGLTSMQELLRVLGPQKKLTRTCPACAQPVATTHRACTRCGTLVSPACRGCGENIETGWSYCPTCAKGLPDATPPA